MKKGLYVIRLGALLFTEHEGKKYVLHTFPYKYHAQYYRDSIDLDPNNPFSVSFWTLDRLWDLYKGGSIAEVYVSTAEPTGNTFIRDLLFPTANSVLH